ncbi:hypothetical protein [Streptomyces sp. NPDC002889]|uniref:hypothetical protein n=1 Tax=Streptomyces sp. NPDC002889 TaxID=3364669 RepID=UPI0036AE0A6C
MHSLLHAGMSAALASGMVFVGTLAVVALAAVFAPTPTRRSDARKVLELLVRRAR